MTLNYAQNVTIIGSMSRTVCVIGCLFLSGCRESASLPLSFDDQDVALGMVHGISKVRQEFPFTVTANHDVVITSIASSCQCMATSSAKVGKPLKPGERGIITLEIDVNEYGGEFAGSITVATSPKSPEALVLRVHGVAMSHPRVSGTQPLVARAPLGDGFTIDLNVVALRPESEPAFIPDLEQSHLGKFRVVSHESVEAPLAPHGAQITTGILERHTFQIQHDQILSATNRQENLEIAWKGTDYRTSLAIRLIATHPLSLAVPEPFLGFVEPGENIEVTFPFYWGLKYEPADVSFEAVNEDKGVASLGAAGKGIHVELTAPSVPGRFRRTWRILTSDKDVPPIDLQITGIVRP